jgi:Pyruvate/2-oxoacid:ferredoxin oxidoreductase gamma subunit
VTAPAKRVEQLDRVVIRFAGDSGDGMQLTGDRFTSETAQLGNDISTLPNFPAEIRAPAGTLPGVSSFQVHFADYDILTPGDAPNVLVAMNPAALKANLSDLPAGADIIVNTDEFTKRNLAKVGYAENPLDDGSLDGYAVHPVALTSMTVGALADSGLSKKDAERAKNMFALGPAELAVLAAVRVDDRLPGAQVRQAAGAGRREHRGVQGGLELRRDDRGLLGPLRVKPARMVPATTATSPATQRWRWASSPPACVEAAGFLGRTRSRRPRTSCTS